MVVNVELVKVTCCSGCVFAISKDLYDYMRRQGENHAMISCPLGHRFHYTNESEEQKIQRLQLEIQRKDNELAAQRAEHERLKMRALRGLCPFCKRNFSNVQRHMSCKHKIIDVNGTKMIEARK